MSEIPVVSTDNCSPLDFNLLIIVCCVIGFDITCDRFEPFFEFVTSRFLFAIDTKQCRQQRLQVVHQFTGVGVIAISYCHKL